MAHQGDNASTLHVLPMEAPNQSFTKPYSPSIRIYARVNGLAVGWCVDEVDALAVVVYCFILELLSAVIRQKPCFRSTSGNEYELFGLYERDEIGQTSLVVESRKVNVCNLQICFG